MDESGDPGHSEKGLITGFDPEASVSRDEVMKCCCISSPRRKLRIGKSRQGSLVAGRGNYCSGQWSPFIRRNRYGLYIKVDILRYNVRHVWC